MTLKKGTRDLSFNLVNYLWVNGAYSREDMIDLVYADVISKQEFFEITRMYFDSVIVNRKEDNSSE